MTSMQMWLVHAGHTMQQLCNCLSKQPQAENFCSGYVQEILWGLLLAGRASCHNAADLYPLGNFSVLQYNTFWDYCWLHHIRMLQGCILCTNCVLLSYNTYLQFSFVPLV